MSMATTSEGRNAVVFVASSCGGWIKVEGTQKQRGKTRHASILNLNRVFIHKVVRIFPLARVKLTQKIKGLELIIRQTTLLSKRSGTCPQKSCIIRIALGSRFPKYSRMESGAPSMQCPAEVKLRVNEADRKALQPLDDLIKRYQDVINSPEFITPIDQLKPVDRIGRKAALEKTKELFGPTRVWKDVCSLRLFMYQK